MGNLPEIKVGEEVIILYKFDWNPVLMPKGKGVITEVKATHFKTTHFDKLLSRKTELVWALNFKCKGESFFSNDGDDYSMQAYTKRRYRYVTEKYMESLRKINYAKHITEKALMKLPKKDFDELVAKLQKLKAIPYIAIKTPKV